MISTSTFMSVPPTKSFSRRLLPAGGRAVDLDKVRTNCRKKDRFVVVEDWLQYRPVRYVAAAEVWVAHNYDVAFIEVVLKGLQHRLDRRHRRIYMDRL